MDRMAIAGAACGSAARPGLSFGLVDGSQLASVAAHPTMTAAPVDWAVVAGQCKSAPMAWYHAPAMTTKPASLGWSVLAR